ncbi:hypothetical protein A3C25_04305 [Candidatus Roizmanbacteria bacterium RIFCSPHIGHO2_02_FULL_38_11]|uniref:Methyltransferase n=1 Tax=Candidatus Roizmanbacteria bacterium RIFCSPHIGHO2_02_FULL_38_11 TaxID=1802039 RepID=A0A1F7H1Y8_9BACT|nr:MAG: hypothetical protein A3C25_04305 [Candidatus Roizmanbacteria bacterium RIFCSPHIGHO2_02_FULL_38_11]
MPKCEICNYRKPKFFHGIAKYTYYKCTRCTTLFLYPKPTVVQITNYYKKSFKYPAGETNEKIIRARAKSILKNLNKLNPNGKTLLDVGSGYGYFIDEAKQINYEAIGVEPSKNLAEISLYPPAGRAGRYNDIVYNLTLQEYFKLNKTTKFDFISLIHTIEHVVNPLETIAKVIKLLNPGGILYIETPNLDSHLFNAEKYNYTFLTPPDHIWLFSQRSIHFILKKIPGIEVEKISTYSYPEHFMGILKSIFIRHSERSRGISYNTNSIEKDPSTHIRSVGMTNNTIAKKTKMLLFDKLLAPLFTPLLNLGIKGSILELYIKKK